MMAVMMITSLWKEDEKKRGKRSVKRGWKEPAQYIELTSDQADLWG